MREKPVDKVSESFDRSSLFSVMGATRGACMLCLIFNKTYVALQLINCQLLHLFLLAAKCKLSYQRWDVSPAVPGNNKLL